MSKKIQSALISVYYKDGLDEVIQALHTNGVRIYSTGGTRAFIEKAGIPCIAVEDLTSYPSILGGRVKTLHPKIFGGILGRREEAADLADMQRFDIPEIDLVIVDLYPFEETLASTSDEKSIVEKIDIGGPSMIRAAAKNFKDLVVIAAREDYADFTRMVLEQEGSTTLEQRKAYAARAFRVVAHYDIAIANYFQSSNTLHFLASAGPQAVLRYGENPHQKGIYFGDLKQCFDQLNGKELSYNNLVDVEAAIQLMREFRDLPATDHVFAIIKHTNVCGIAVGGTSLEAWEKALAGDPESAFGGVLICNKPIDPATAKAIQEIFFEVLIAPAFDTEALALLSAKKNRILLRQHALQGHGSQYRSLLGGVLMQDEDGGDTEKWEEMGGRISGEEEKKDLLFANIVCKHLKSNAIALVKNRQLIGKGCGQTSRIDAVRHALDKARQFQFDLNGAVMASDAFFPFDDCVRIGHAAGIGSFIQPGGSIRDKDSTQYCRDHGLCLVMTGMRHFRH